MRRPSEAPSRPPTSPGASCAAAGCTRRPTRHRRDLLEIRNGRTAAVEAGRAAANARACPILASAAALPRLAVRTSLTCAYALLRDNEVGPRLSLDHGCSLAPVAQRFDEQGKGRRGLAP